MLRRVTSISDSMDINAAPDVVFSTVSDLPQMGRFSPENTGGSWLNAPSARVGARFKGTNANGPKTWTTTATVTTCDAPSSFAFDVAVGPFKIARWRYDLEETATGTKLTETWMDQRGALSLRISKKIREDREGFTRESIRTTLEKIRDQFAS